MTLSPIVKDPTVRNGNCVYNRPQYQLAPLETAASFNTKGPKDQQTENNNEKILLRSSQAATTTDYNSQLTCRSRNEQLEEK